MPDLISSRVKIPGSSLMHIRIRPRIIGDKWRLTVLRNDCYAPLYQGVGKVQSGGDEYSCVVGIVPPVYLGTGVPSATTFLSGDQSWVTLEVGTFIPITPTPPYTVTNVSDDRAYDALTTSVDEVAQVLGTLINDLRTSGIIGT